MSVSNLAIRWTELGAWSPVMRTHHGTEPKLEWSWQSDAETTAHFARYARPEADAGHRHLKRDFICHVNSTPVIVIPLSPLTRKGKRAARATIG